VPQTVAMLASAFLASLGVGAPIHYTDGKYADVATVLADLDYLGIHTIRTGAWWHGMTGEWSYHLAAKAGVRFDMVLNATDRLDAAVAQMARFAADHPGSVAVIEGPNEINNFGAHYRGLAGAAAAVAFQDDLYARVAADAVLRGTRVYSYTMNAGATSVTGYDFAAIHPYAVDGRPPRWFLDNNIAKVPPGKRFVVTETGYPTLIGGKDGVAKDGVDARAQAIYNLDMIFDATSAGAAAVYLYELRDAYADPGWIAAGKHFGLFDYANQPKPIAVALHTMARILTANAVHGAPGALDFTAPDAARTLLLQKAPAVFDLVVWDEAPLWDHQANHAIARAERARTIRFARAPTTITVYDPLRGTAPVAAWHRVGAVTLSLGSDPLVVEVTM